MLRECNPLGRPQSGISPATGGPFHHQMTSNATEALRDKFAAVYAKRTLTGKSVSLDSQVRAITAFLNGDFSVTTGQIVNVDAGQAAAFQR